MASVGGTDRALLKRFAQVVGGGKISGPYRRERTGAWNKKPVFFLQAYTNACGMARTLWPFLGLAKRDKIATIQNSSKWQGASVPIADQTVTAPKWSRLGLAWAAGFFDAEGCFSFSQRTGPSATITNTDRDQLGRFFAAVGVGKIYGPYRLKVSEGINRKPQYSYRTTGLEKTQAIAAMLWFKLGSAKKEQARMVLSQVRTTCRRGHPKQPGHAGCGQCMKDYWRSRRDARRNSTGESAPAYLIA